MDAERMANAETADQLKEAAGTGAGPSGADPSAPRGTDTETTDSFYGDPAIYPAGAGMRTPTGHLDEPAPTEGLSEAETEEEGGRSPRQ